MAIKIYIDQGHNPQNPNSGAEGNGLREQDLTYNIGNRLALLLRENSNFDVRVSRSTPETILGTSNATSLAARVNDANAWGADYFISLHANASEITTALGSEAYVFALPSTAGIFATAILEGMVETTQIPSRGVFVRPTLYVLRKTRMPAVLIELGFITTPQEAFLMSEQPDLYASGMYIGILQFFGIM